MNTLLCDRRVKAEPSMAAVDSVVPTDRLRMADLAAPLPVFLRAGNHRSNNSRYTASVLAVG